MEIIRFANGVEWHIDDVLNFFENNIALPMSGPSEYTLFLQRNGGWHVVDSYPVKALRDRVTQIVFIDDTTPDDLLFSKYTQTQISIDYSDYSAGVTFLGNERGFPLQRVEFGNGEVWDFEQVKAKMLEGTDDSQSLTAFDTGSEIHAAGGDDFIHGSKANDKLYGDAGNDWIIANEGDDLLVGGTGDDNLMGGSGSDIYLFSRGDGQDVITDMAWSEDSNSQDTDILRFSDDIFPADVIVTRDKNNLILSISDTTDQVTISEYFYDNKTYLIEIIEFSNGISWFTADIMAYFSDNIPLPITK
ncbi:hypothetical protein SOASR029_41110 [Budvicia aquatica]|nr:calcium-binding protein [Budvicia aquatica]GKX53802.1 hypothetical protein SOASR029_41110 [Budvicia aquatica]